MFARNKKALGQTISWLEKILLTFYQRFYRSTTNYLLEVSTIVTPTFALFFPLAVKNQRA